VFSTLLESRPTRQRRTGSSVASIVGHSLVITAAVVATARDTMSGLKKPEQVEVVYFPHTAPPPPAPRPARRASASVIASPSTSPLVQRIVVPTAIPTSIPAVDFSAVAGTTDFIAAPIGTADVLCATERCRGHALVEGDHVLWSSADVAMRVREQIPPRYPESLRRAGIEGDVLTKFVVDTTGRIEMRSIEILSATHEGFSAAVREALARMRFTPSMVGERKVRALAVMPFRFTLR
jgi:periplasmic protein TonB